MDAPTPKVFVSIGSNSSDREKQAADLIFRSLETAGLSPRQMGRNEWTAEQPLRGIRQVIENCSGVVVIAFHRYSFAEGTERQKGGAEKTLTDIKMTTVWNHIEASLGIANGLPLLVIAEHGLLEDGLLEGKYDWKVYWTDYAPERFQSDEFLGVLKSWKRLVLLQTATAPPVNKIEPPAITPDVSKMSMRELSAAFTVPQIWAVLSALAGFFAAAVTIAYKLGQGKLHP